MLDLSGISLPFSVGDMIGGGMELIGLVGGVVVLALALIFAPNILEMIKGIFRTHKNNKFWEKHNHPHMKDSYLESARLNFSRARSKKYRNGE